MPQIELTPAQRKVHRAAAHHLDPVVMIGADGLTPAVLRETDAALQSHGLIKIRVLSDDRQARAAFLERLAAELSAAPIQHIGKLLVLWRPASPKERKSDEARKPGPREVKILKQTRPGQRPEVKILKVLGNQRLTPGGKVKKARKPAQRSIKKSAS